MAYDTDRHVWLNDQIEALESIPALDNIRAELDIPNLIEELQELIQDDLDLLYNFIYFSIAHKSLPRNNHAHKRYHELDGLASTVLEMSPSLGEKFGEMIERANRQFEEKHHFKTDATLEDLIVFWRANSFLSEEFFKAITKEKTSEN